MIELRHVAARFYNRPLWLAPSAAETISAFLLSRMASVAARGGAAAGEQDPGETTQFFRPTAGVDGSMEAHSPRASRFYGDYPLGDDGRPAPYRRTPDGTAIMTLVGEWVNRGAWVGASSGLVSYEGFSYQMRRAGADAKTSGILLDIESPGGEAVGAFEAAAVVREVSAIKPVTALVNGMAASSAYAIASGASRIVTIPTGMSGSIGVVLMHLDLSKYLENEGIKPTLIFAGDHKVDGNPFEPLPKDVRAELQHEVSSFYDQFVETVALGRRMDPKAVRETQARMFKGSDALDAGLADEVGSFESALADLSPARMGRQKGVTMENKGAAPAATANAADGIARADHDHAVTTASSAAGAASQARIKAILTAKEAAGRGTLAQHLALETEMSAEASIALLAKAPKEAEDKASRLDGRVPAPNVNSASAAPTDVAASWDAVTAKLNAETKASHPGRA